MQRSGRNYTIEDCHWGKCTAGDDSSCPTKDWCPFNTFRTSGDIRPTYGSVVSNLLTAVPFNAGQVGTTAAQPSPFRESRNNCTCWVTPAST